MKLRIWSEFGRGNGRTTPVRRSGTEYSRDGGNLLYCDGEVRQLNARFLSASVQGGEHGWREGGEDV